MRDHDENTTKVRKLLKNRPDTTAREAEQTLGIPRSTVNRITRKIKAEETGQPSPVLYCLSVELDAKTYAAFKKLAKARLNSLADEGREMIADWLRNARKRAEAERGQ